MTNYERIKSMSIEEMAEMLAWEVDCYECPAAINGCSSDFNKCAEQQKKWLESEVEA